MKTPRMPTHWFGLRWRAHRRRTRPSIVARPSAHVSGRAGTPILRSIAASTFIITLVSCATFSKDGGFDSVATLAQARLGKQIQWSRSEDERAKADRQVAALLDHPLSAEDAVQIALLGSPMLQSSFEELGVSEADLVQAGRLPNPRFTLRHASALGQYDIEETLTFNILSLLTMPYAEQIEKHRFEQVQAAALSSVVQLAGQTREAYFAAVAAHDSLEYLRQVKSAADAGAELARRMLAAGNWNRLDEARERGFYIDAEQGLRRAELADQASRERLIRLMGLSGAEPRLELAEHLPDLPAGIDEPPDVEQGALQDRIDLHLLRSQIDELAQGLKLGRASRFVNVLDAGPARVKQGTGSQPYERGYEVSFEVPIFDSGAPRVRKAEARYAQAVDRFTQASIDARSQIRLAYASYRAAFDIARQQRDELLPTRKSIAEQNLLRYNASLISVFDLLADARSQISGVNDSIQSLRDFWIAKSQLDTVLLGSPSP